MHNRKTFWDESECFRNDLRELCSRGKEFRLGREMHAKSGRLKQGCNPGSLPPLHKKNQEFSSAPFNENQRTAAAFGRGQVRLRSNNLVISLICRETKLVFHLSIVWSTMKP
jgi:hypothetical protein